MHKLVGEVFLKHQCSMFQSLQAFGDDKFLGQINVIALQLAPPTNVCTLPPEPAATDAHAICYNAIDWRLGGDGDCRELEWILQPHLEVLGEWYVKEMSCSK